MILIWYYCPDFFSYYLCFVKLLEHISVSSGYFFPSRSGVGVSLGMVSAIWFSLLEWAKFFLFLCLSCVFYFLFFVHWEYGRARRAQWGGKGDMCNIFNIFKDLKKKKATHTKKETKIGAMERLSTLLVFVHWLCPMQILISWALVLSLRISMRKKLIIISGPFWTCVLRWPLCDLVNAPIYSVAFQYHHFWRSPSLKTWMVCCMSPLSVSLPLSQDVPTASPAWEQSWAKQRTVLSMAPRQVSMWFLKRLH